MRLPIIHGLIRRRILVNYRVAPEILGAQLPSPFRPKLWQGSDIAGLCLIRLEQIRPHLVPAILGFSSENAAHRIAVVWQEGTGEQKEGVFIPRRDTGSRLNRLAGGRVFPGEHHGARFRVQESQDSLDLAMESLDGAVTVRVRGAVGGDLPSTSCFGSLSDASAFFEGGSLGYSVTSSPERLDALELRTHGWRVEVLRVEEHYSSYFSDTSRFPDGSVAFDCALVMRNLAHEWHERESLHVGGASVPHNNECS